jgi:hypothetical protein
VEFGTTPSTSTGEDFVFICTPKKARLGSCAQAGKAISDSPSRRKNVFFMIYGFDAT